MKQNGLKTAFVECGESEPDIKSYLTRIASDYKIKKKDATG